MEIPNLVRVTIDNWVEIVNKIDWRQPEAVDPLGNRILKAINGTTAYQIPFELWYDTRAYEKPWRRYMERTAQPAI
jgi:hypothetical protein